MKKKKNNKGRVLLFATHWRVSWADRQKAKDAPIGGTDIAEHGTKIKQVLYFRWYLPRHKAEVRKELIEVVKSTQSP